MDAIRPRRQASLCPQLFEDDGVRTGIHHPIALGTRTLGFRFTAKEKSLNPDFFTGDVTLLIDGKPAGDLKYIKMAGQYSTFTGYGLLIGRNTGTPVSQQYEPPFTFTGGLEKVTIEAAPNVP